ncbi:hypothetical protein D047_2013A, partial [Vibrio parahaemolyticus VPTS-2010_2]
MLSVISCVSASVTP